MKISKLANLGLFSALAIILGYVESLFPFFSGIPGIKLGLANLAVLFMLHRCSWKDAAIVSVIRILVIGFLFGNLFSILYSLAGAALSLVTMALVQQHTHFSIFSISICGGVSHNIGQLLIAMILVQNTALSIYAPALLISGIVTGALIGFLVIEVNKRLYH